MVKVEEIVQAFIAIAILVSAGAIFMHYNEGWNYLDSYYFATVTLTTVGYGDLLPSKPSSKLFIIFYVLFGISTLLYFVSRLTRPLAEQLQHQSSKVSRRFRPKK